MKIRVVSPGTTWTDANEEVLELSWEKNWRATNHPPVILWNTAVRSRVPCLLCAEKKAKLLWLSCEQPQRIPPTKDSQVTTDGPLNRGDERRLGRLRRGKKSLLRWWSSSRFSYSPIPPPQRPESNWIDNTRDKINSAEGILYKFKLGTFQETIVNSPAEADQFVC